MAHRARVLLDRIHWSALAEVQKQRLQEAAQRQQDRMARAAARLVNHGRIPSYIEFPKQFLHDKVLLGFVASPAAMQRLHCTGTLWP